MEVRFVESQRDGIHSEHRQVAGNDATSTDLGPGQTPAKNSPELERYFQITNIERDWVLSGAVGYLFDLEVERLPSQRLAANSAGPDSGLLLRFANASFRRRLDRCLRHLRRSEESVVKLDWARSVGLGEGEDLLCLAAMQFANAVQIKSRRLARETNNEHQLWDAYLEFMQFCHTKAYALLAMYEEHPRRQAIDRKSERAPNESYAEWRNRASAPVVEMRPLSVQFIRPDDAPTVGREDRSGFHRHWIDKQIADAWQFGSVPFR